MNPNNIDYKLLLGSKKHRTFPHSQSSIRREYYGFETGIPRKQSLTSAFIPGSHIQDDNIRASFEFLVVDLSSHFLSHNNVNHRHQFIFVNIPIGYLSIQMFQGHCKISVSGRKGGPPNRTSLFQKKQCLARYNLKTKKSKLFFTSKDSCYLGDGFSSLA